MSDNSRQMSSWRVFFLRKRYIERVTRAHGVYLTPTWPVESPGERD